MKILTGAGGGGGGSPTIKPDNLLSDDIVEMTLGICEGPIAGLHNGPQSFYLDDTPLVGASGESNFNPFELHMYHGDPVATPVRNVLGGVSSNSPVGVELAQSTPVTRVTTSTLRNQIDALEVRIQVNSLVNSQKDGDQVQTSVQFRIQYRPAGTTIWEKFYGEDIEIRGKTTSGYARDFMVQVPRIDNDWEIQVVKLSSDSDPRIANSITWESYQMTTAEDRSYDNLALVRVLGQASDQFRGIPNMSGVYGAKLIMVPSNYDPITRYYDGLWDGTFKLAHTDNPAWIVYDILTNDVYGFRRHYPRLLVNRFATYEWGRWCDELVSRPGGGYQPRWTYNDQTSQSRSALDLLYYICGATGAMPVEDLNGTISFKIDKPEAPVQVFGAESVTAEGFSYQFTPIEQRPNDITVKFINPNLDWNEDYRRVFNQNLIDKFGRIPEELVAVGCNDVYEAQRRAFRRLTQANTETLTVNFTTTRAGMQLEAFDVIGISDPTMGWGLSGRIKSRTDATLYLRDALFLPVNENLQLQVTTPSGVHEVTVQASQPNTTELTITGGIWPADAPEKAQFAITSNTLGLVKPFRILTIKEDDQESDALQITALELNVNKYGDIDNLQSSGVVEYSFAQENFPSAPFISSVQSGAGHYIINEDGTVFPRVLVEWQETRLDATIISYEIQAREQTTGDLITQASTKRDAYLTGLKIGATYDITVVSINNKNNRSIQSNSVQHTVLGKSETLTLAEPWVGVSGVGSISLQGPEAEIPDFSHFKVYQYDAQDAQIGVPDTFASTTYTRQVPEGDLTAAYRVSMVDTSGNESNLSAPIAVFPREVQGSELAQQIRDQIEEAETQAQQAVTDANQALTNANQVQQDLQQTQQNFQNDIDSLQVDYNAVTLEAQRAEDASNLAQEIFDRTRHTQRGLLNPGFESAGAADTPGVPSGWIGKAHEPLAFEDGRLKTVDTVPGDSSFGSTLAFGAPATDTSWWGVGQRVLAFPAQIFDLSFMFWVRGKDDTLWVDDDNFIAENDFLVEANWYDSENNLLSTDVSIGLVTQWWRLNSAAPASQTWLPHIERLVAPDDAAYLEFYIVAVDNSDNPLPTGRETYAEHLFGGGKNPSGYIDDIDLTSTNGTVFVTTEDTAVAGSYAAAANQSRLDAEASNLSSSSAAAISLDTLTSVQAVATDIETSAQGISEDRLAIETSKGEIETLVSDAAAISQDVNGVLATVQQTESVAIRAVARSRPIDFEQDGLMWSGDLARAPEDRRPLENVTFVTTDRGRAARIAGDLAEGVQISPLAYVTLQPNRRYRCSVVARHLGALGVGEPIAIQARTLDAVYETVTTATTGFSFAQPDTWEEFTAEFMTDGTPPAYLNFIVYKPASYVEAGTNIEILQLAIDDVTESFLAEGFAEVSQEHSLDAFAYLEDAEAAAGLAEQSLTEVNAGVAAAQVIETNVLNVKQDVDTIKSEIIAAETQVVTTASGIERSIASIVPNIPRAPASAWTNQPWNTTELVRPPVDEAEFVTDDVEFGYAFVFNSTANRTLGPAAGLRFDPNTVYEVEVFYRVVEDDPGGDTDIQLGASVYNRLSAVQVNLQTGTRFTGSMADGTLRARVWISERDLSNLVSPDVPEELLQVTNTGATLFYPYVRQNGLFGTDGRIAVGSFNVRDVTAFVDAIEQAELAAISRTDALQAVNDAQGYATEAQTSLSLIASVTEQGAGVLMTPNLAPFSPQGFSRWLAEGNFTSSDNTVYSNGKDYRFDITNVADQDGFQSNSTRDLWSGPTNAGAYLVEIDFTLASGTLDGAGVALDWNTDVNNYRAALELSEMAIEGQPGEVQRAIGYLVKPSSTTGIFDRHNFWFFANYGGNGFTEATKDITFHRVFFRVARQEELGGGQVAESVQATLTQNYYTIAQTNTAISNEVTQQVATITGGTFEELTSQILTDYRTAAQIDSTIASALTTFESELQDPTGPIGIITASLSQDYYTKTQVDNELGTAVSGIETRLGGISGSTYGAIEDIQNLNLDPNSALLQSLSTLEAGLSTAQAAMDNFEGAQAGSYLVALTDVADMTAGDAVSVSLGAAALDLASSLKITENSTSRVTTGSTNGASFLITEDRAAHLSGKRVRVDVLARRASTNAAANFSVVYSTADNGNSGAMTAEVIQDDQWHWYSFYYDRPVIGSITPDYVAIFPDDSKTGKALDVSRVMIRPAIVADELPELGTLSGTVEALAGIQLDALTGTAFASFMEQLSVDASGTSAKVTEFSATKAQLDGFASTYTGLTAEVSGGFISGIKATSFANPDGTGAATLQLLGDVFASGSFSTNKLTVGLQQNLLGDGRNLSVNTPWWFLRPFGTAGDECTFRFRDKSFSYSGVDHPVLEIKQEGVDIDGYADIQYQHYVDADKNLAPGIPVSELENYSLSARVFALRCKVEMRIRWFDVTGTSIGFSSWVSTETTSTDKTAVSDWPLLFLIKQPPANAAFAAPHFRKLPTQTGVNSYMFVDEVMMSVTHADAKAPNPFSPPSTLFADGGNLFADSITAREISVENLEALGIKVRDIDIEEGSVGSLQIADEIYSDNYAEDNDGRPQAGWVIRKDGTWKTSGGIISRPLVVAQGELTIPAQKVLQEYGVFIGLFLVPGNPVWVTRNLGIFDTGVELTDVGGVWEPIDESYSVVASIKGEPDAYAHRYNDDPDVGSRLMQAGLQTAVYPITSIEEGRTRLMMSISLRTYNIYTLNGHPSDEESSIPFEIEWAVKKLT